MPFIVEIEAGCWLADWSGDPGRTINRDHAKVYLTARSAKSALTAARRNRKLPFAKIIPLEPLPELPDAFKQILNDKT